MDISYIDCDSDDAVLIGWKSAKDETENLDSALGIKKSISDSCLTRHRESLALLGKRPHSSMESDDAIGKVSEEEEIARLFKRARIECEMHIAQHKKFNQQENIINAQVELGRMGKCYRWFTSLFDWYQEDVPRFLFWACATYTVVRVGEYL